MPCVADEEPTGGEHRAGSQVGPVAGTAIPDRRICDLLHRRRVGAPDRVSGVSTGQHQSGPARGGLVSQDTIRAAMSRAAAGDREGHAERFRGRRSARGRARRDDDTVSGPADRHGVHRTTAVATRAKIAPRQARGCPVGSAGSTGLVKPGVTVDMNAHMSSGVAASAPASKASRRPSPNRGHGRSEIGPRRSSGQRWRALRKMALSGPDRRERSRLGEAAAPATTAVRPSSDFDVLGSRVGRATSTQTESRCHRAVRAWRRRIVRSRGTDGPSAAEHATCDSLAATAHPGPRRSVAAGAELAPCDADRRPQSATSATSPSSSGGSSCPR